MPRSIMEVACTAPPDIPLTEASLHNHQSSEIESDPLGDDSNMPPIMAPGLPPPLRKASPILFEDSESVSGSSSTSSSSSFRPLVNRVPKHKRPSSPLASNSSGCSSSSQSKPFAGFLCNVAVKRRKVH